MHTQDPLDISFDDDDILPEARIFDNRADDIWNTKMEAYEDLLIKNKQREEEVALETEKNELLMKIEVNLKNKQSKQKKGKGKKNKNVAVLPDEDESPTKIQRRISARLRSQTDNQDKDAEKDKDHTTSDLKFTPSAQKRIKKLQIQTEREKKRVDEETRRILSACEAVQEPEAEILIDDDIPMNQNVSLKVRFFSRISKVNIGQMESFEKVFKTVAELYGLEATEILLCHGDRNIELIDTPLSLKLKNFDVIDCIPYKPTKTSDSNNLLLKIQSNDSRKKTELYTHKLEKFEEVMKRYAELREISLKDLVFEFDGEKIEGTETPSDLDMESGSCIDVRVLNYKEPPPKRPTVVDIVEDYSPIQMLDICVLD